MGYERQEGAGGCAKGDAHWGDSPSVTKETAAEAAEKQPSDDELHTVNKILAKDQQEKDTRAEG